MGIREKINKNQHIVLGVTICVIVLALIFIIMQSRRGGYRGAGAMMAKAFYTDDDGKTWFIDEGQKIVPFDHNGKPAVRARVFRCKEGSPFVAYLERYNDAIKSRIQEAAAHSPNGAASDFSLMPMDVKKPGETKWFNPAAPNASASEYGRITTPICPGGGIDPSAPVSPGDPDNGASN